jgi:hypothetical protein
MVKTENGDRNVIIHNARPGDAGEYTCSAENEAGRAEKTYMLHVHCLCFII